MEHKPLKVGEVASLCGVSTKTVKAWIDAGLLKGWRIPGSLHRRVDRDDLRVFLTNKGLHAKARALEQEQTDGAE